MLIHEGHGSCSYNASTVCRECVAVKSDIKGVPKHHMEPWVSCSYYLAVF